MDELSTTNPPAAQFLPSPQTELKRAKFPQIQTQIHDLRAMYAQVVSELNRMTRSAKRYDALNRTNTFDKERASDGENVHIKLEYWALVDHLVSKEEQLQKATAEYISDCRTSLGLVNINNSSPYKPPHLMRLEKSRVQLAMKMQELKIFRCAYAQAGRTLDDMAIEVEKEDGRDGTGNFKESDSPVGDHVHAERQKTYQSSVEKQQNMHTVLTGIEIGLQNALIYHEHEIYRYYEKEFADIEAEVRRLMEHLQVDIEAEVRRLKEHLQIELRNQEENLARFESKSLLLFLLLSITTIIISLNQLVTWTHDHISWNNH